MRLPTLPADSLPQFIHFHPITLNGIVPRHLGGAPIDLGIALVSTGVTPDPSRPLLRVDQSLVLTQASIEAASKSDRQLYDALSAAGLLARTPRGACIIFLLLRMSTAAGILSGGDHDAWCAYSQFLPTEVPLPTTWTGTERAVLTGTSLEPAVAAKLRALAAEFSSFRAATAEIPWARQAWWDTDALTLQDWVHADCLFRSRSVELPGSGAAMVPVLDLANHCDEMGGTGANAFFSVSANDGAVELWGEPGGESAEVTIDYSANSKSAAEFVFSYGFLPRGMTRAGSVVLPLSCTSDDPLLCAKAVVWRGGMTVTLREDSWDSPWVFLAVTNEEDGLCFRVLQTNEGATRLQVQFCGQELEEPQRLQEQLRDGDMWEVFELRAVATVAATVQEALARMRTAKVAMEEEEEAAGRVQQREVGARLREMEETLLMRVGEVLRVQQETLLAHPTVQAYLLQGEEEEQQQPQPQALSVDVDIDLS